MDTGPQEPAVVVEPAEDPFERREEPERREPARVPQEQPA